MKKLLLLVTVAAGLLLARDSHAGVPPSTNYGGCYQSNGSGYCYGTMLGFQTLSDPSAYAGFDYGSGNIDFFARVNGSLYSCYAPASLYSDFALAIGSQGYFYVAFSNGACTSLEFETTSYTAHW
jgi:hypothetical protein